MFGQRDKEIKTAVNPETKAYTGFRTCLGRSSETQRRISHYSDERSGVCGKKEKDLTDLTGFVLQYI